MPDNQGGRADSDFIAATQDHEVDYVARKYTISKDEVLAAIKAVGNERRKVYEYLDNRRSGGSQSNSNS